MLEIEGTAGARKCTSARLTDTIFCLLLSQTSTTQIAFLRTFKLRPLFIRPCALDILTSSWRPSELVNMSRQSGLRLQNTTPTHSLQNTSQFFICSCWRVAEFSFESLRVNFIATKCSQTVLCLPSLSLQEDWWVLQIFAFQRGRFGGSCWWGFRIQNEAAQLNGGFRRTGFQGRRED